MLSRVKFPCPCRRDSLKKEVSGSMDLRKLSYLIFISILRPDDKFRIAWDVMLTILLVYIAVSLPYKLAFTRLSDYTGYRWLGADAFIDLTFLVVRFHQCNGFPGLRNALDPGTSPIF